MFRMFATGAFERVVLLVEAMKTGDFELLIQQPSLSLDVCRSLLMYLEVGQGSFDAGQARCQRILDKTVFSFLKLSQYINMQAQSQQRKGASILAQLNCIWFEGLYALTSPGTLSAAKHVELVEAMLAAKVPEVRPGLQ